MNCNCGIMDNCPLLLVSFLALVGVEVLGQTLRRQDCPNSNILLNIVWNRHLVGDYGCHKGRCWSRCSGVSGVAWIPGYLVGAVFREWCYTTQKKRAQNYEYVSCEVDGQCCQNWYCAGPCAIF